jgi:hypothetical protein
MLSTRECVSDDLGSIPAAGIVSALGGAIPDRAPDAKSVRCVVIGAPFTTVTASGEEAVATFLTDGMDNFAFDRVREPR